MSSNKKLYLGSLLFLISFIEFLTFIILSITHPAQAVGKDGEIYTGLIGLLKANGFTSLFIISCLVGLFGLTLCFFETFKKQ